VAAVRDRRQAGFYLLPSAFVRQRPPEGVGDESTSLTVTHPCVQLGHDIVVDGYVQARGPRIATAVKGRSEVDVGTDEGLPETSVIACDNVVTIPKSALDADPVGRLGVAKRVELDQGLRYALDIRY